MTASLPVETRVVVGAFVASGALHLIRPQPYEPLVPEVLGDARAWVYGSGVVELTCAAGLIGRQSWAPAATAGTLTAIWVGNVHMALRWQRSERVAPWAKALAWARLPLQVPLIVWAIRSPTS